MIELSIHAGTNVSFSPSYEYLDQVLLPALQDHFGIHVERRLERRRWSQGSSSEPKGEIWFRFRPLRPGQTLKLISPSPSPSLPLPLLPPTRRKEENLEIVITRIDISIVAPTAVLAPLERAITQDLETRFLARAAEVQVVAKEDSGHDSRLYALLVAQSEETQGSPGSPAPALRWGCDWLYDRSAKRKTPEQLGNEIARRVCADLEREVGGRGVVDEYLQDQLVVFQALAEGRTSFPRTDGDVEEEDDEDEDLELELELAKERLEIGDEEEGGRGGKKERRMRRDKTHEPFGDGSTHTKTARWVASELLPAVQWFNGGSICDGAGLSFK